MFEMTKVSIRIDDKPILQGIDLIWKKGEAIALNGANGAGKSTLLRVVAGLIKPSDGSVAFPDGLDRRDWQKVLGVVFPDNFLYEDLTVEENLRFYGKIYGIKNEKYMDYLLDFVNLSQVSDDFVRTLSKGMKQRLSIARALVHRPPYLLLDEPFEGLDIASQEWLERTLNHLSSQSVGILLVSHNMEQAWRLCQRMILIHDGRLVLEKVCDSKNYLDFKSKYQALFGEKNDNVF